MVRPTDGPAANELDEDDGWLVALLNGMRREASEADEGGSTTAVSTVGGGGPELDVSSSSGGGVCGRARARRRVAISWSLVSDGCALVSGLWGCWMGNGVGARKGASGLRAGGEGGTGESSPPSITTSIASTARSTGTSVDTTAGERAVGSIHSLKKQGYGGGGGKACQPPGTPALELVLRGRVPRRHSL